MLSNPSLADVYRKDIIESCHRGSVIVVNHLGETVFSLGDVERGIYPRSSLKFFQAIPLVESGAADHFQLSDAEIALACSSHNAENIHTSAVQTWLNRMDLDIEDLENGPDMPQYEEADALVEFVDSGRAFQLAPDAFAGWELMRDAAGGKGVELQVVSAFRSVKRQTEIVERKRKKGLSDEEIFKVSARPGYSEHHTGKAIDLTTPGFLALEEEFENSEAFQWLVKNANGFGFYLSYPRDNRYGIIYEPWHWCFKGSI